MSAVPDRDPDAPAGGAERIAQTAAERQARMMTGALQSAERAMLSWVRTGIALMVLGFMLARFDVLLAVGGHAGGATSLLPTPLVAAAVIAQGAAVCIWAAVRYLRAHKAIEAGDTGAPGPTGPTVVAAGTVALAAVLGALVWTLAPAAR